MQTKEIRAMSSSNTVLKQLLSFVPRYEFDALAAMHHSGQKFRSYNRWSQFLAMLIGQLAGKEAFGISPTIFRPRTNDSITSA
jgi:hypothetical protein